MTVLIFFATPAHAAQERWVVYYGDKLPASQFTDYDVIVFDSDHHPELAPLKGKTLLGYISLGEAEDYRSYYNALAKKNLLLSENKLWKGHHIIDIRKPAWKAYMLDVLIPATLAQGFTGIMLDTLDTPLSLEQQEPETYQGMHEAAVDIISAIRVRYPDIKIMLNRGFTVLPDVAEDIDMVMAETIYTDWQPGTKQPVIQPKQDYDAYRLALAEAKNNAPGLKIYTIDYWPAKDKQQVKLIYARQREAGFVPYVAPSLGLQDIGKEPL